jgi:choline dehydrogenase-like flavoprotein
LSQNLEQGVVDSELEVHGIENLRVIDASVFPIIPDCRIQNDVYMVAEKGADMIKSTYPDLYRQQSSLGDRLKETVKGARGL